jgi:Zn-dependent protease with chaperone function
MTADELAALGARLAAEAGVAPAPDVVIRPAPWGGRRSLASARLDPPVTIAVTVQAAAALPDWRLEAVVAHELGHVGQNRRLLDGAQVASGGGLVATGLAALAVLLGVAAAGILLIAAAAVTAAGAVVFLSLSKRMEYEADDVGAGLVGAAVLADHLEQVAHEHHELPALFHLTLSHPPSRRRARRLRSLTDRSVTDQ